MKEKDILEKLYENQIEVFLVKTGLDVECDVILENNNMDEFIRFCNFTNNKVAFCEMTYVELEDYVVDEDEIREEIREVLEEKLEESYFDEGNELTADNFNDEINKLIKDVQVHNKKVTAKINALNEPEIFFADIYVIHNGVQVGVSMHSNYMEEYPMAFEVMEEMKENIEELIVPKLALYEMDRSSYFEKMVEQRQREREEQRRAEREKYQKTLLEIEVFIKNDASLSKCTNRKLRHAYAKRIAEEYSEKCELRITIADVEAKVDEIYESLKA